MMRAEFADPATLRDVGMTQAECAADPRIIAAIDAAIDAAIARANATGEPWSANSIRDQLPVTTRGLVGARINAARMRRPVEMVQVGEVQSTLGSTHAKRIGLWRGVAAVMRGVA